MTSLPLSEELSLRDAMSDRLHVSIRVLPYAAPRRTKVLDCAQDCNQFALLRMDASGLEVRTPWNLCLNCS
jgi:hypothetical protein